MPVDSTGAAQVGCVAATVGVVSVIKPAACMDIFGDFGTPTLACAVSPCTTGTASTMDVVFAIDTLGDACAKCALGSGNVAGGVTLSCAMGAETCKAGVSASTGAADEICMPGASEAGSSAASSETDDDWSGTASPTNSASTAGTTNAPGVNRSTDAVSIIELAGAHCAVSVP